jgi:uncharacterized membrane protein YoaK (UPF0700 family)
MATEIARSPSAKWHLAWAGVLLTGVAGYVDALGYLKYFQIFSANMSGNHIRLGIDVTEGRWADAGLRLLPIASFAVGVVIAELLVVGKRGSLRLRAVAPLWVMEAAALLVVMLGDQLVRDTHGRDLVLLGLLAFAMGMQNTSLRRSRSLDVFTTHVTGVLTTACMGVAKGLRGLGRRKAERGRRRRGISSRKIWRGSLPVVYIVGAAAGAEGLRLAGIYALAVAAMLLLVLCGLSWMEW